MGRAPRGMKSKAIKSAVFRLPFGIGASSFSQPMKKNHAHLVLTGICLAGFGHTAERTPVVEGSLKPFLGKPRMEMGQVFKGERMPNVVVTLKGTVLATFGTRSVRACRSEDGGKTWGPEIVIDFFEIGLKVRDPEHDRIGATLSIGVPAGGCVGEDQTQIEDVALLSDFTSKDLLR